MLSYKYFAYGSNLYLRRLRKRTPSASFIAVAQLRGHELRFHKVSRLDGSGKCDAFATGVSTDWVWGVVFEIPSAEKSQLDKAEGLGVGYKEKTVDVITKTGSMPAFTYVASSEAIRADLQPFAWYKKYVMAGAIEHDLPLEYVDAIRAVATSQDPDADRRRRHEQFLNRAPA